LWGFILKKSKKPDYSQPKAYRVIALLNCLGKISERILARRLSYLAETTNLLHYSQIGSRLHKSAIDAALLLQNEVQNNKANKLKTTTLFLDIKGAFDHVSKNRLIEVLVDLKLPISLIKWIFSFMSDRVLRLVFNDNIESFSPINTGIPQGSPISPILFLIYIRDLFESKSITFLSYMDDISLSAASKSYKQNIKILERETKDIFELGEKYAIKFDFDKTDLIHFYSGKNHQLNLILPNGNIIKPKKLIKWLGIYFDSNLRYKEHINIRTSQAKQAFYRLNRLSNITNGLSPFAIRQLYLACITSISDYGSELWWDNNKSIKPLQAVQNLATRKILGVFKTAPLLPMQIESALPPVKVRLNHKIRCYTLRALKLSLNHPIKLEVNKAIKAIKEFKDELEISTNNSSISSYNLNSKNPQSQNHFIRLVESIYDLVDLKSLEYINHFYFAPWDKNININIRISNMPKEEEANNHLKYLESISKTNTNNNIYSIYTDGSQMANGLGVGFSFVVYKHNTPYIPLKPIYSEYGNIGDCNIAYNGELEAITKALEYASNIALEGDHFNIFSDNQAGILRLKTPSDKPGQNQQIRSIIASKVINVKKAKINLIWVPGHSDILGNEKADELAKLAANSPNCLISDKTSFAYLGILINRLKKQEILNILNKEIKPKSLESYSNIFPWTVFNKISLPKGTKRALASSFFQLKLGHGYLKSYLYRLNLISNNKCKCGIKETTLHLILNCKNYDLERKSLFLRIKEKLGIRTINLPVLFQTKIGISELLVFLKETNICTRNWYIERKMEEERDALRDVFEDF
jgi:ribonuclease HI